MTHLQTCPAERISVDKIADWLLPLLPDGRPRRVARMYEPGTGDKYRDIPKAKPFTRHMLIEHVAGRQTWAATLDLGDMARLGVIEIDQGGRAAVCKALSYAQRLGVTAFGIAVDNPRSGHSGGHVWVLYRDFLPVGTIIAQLQCIVGAAQIGDVELWPCKQVIRLPLGYHRWAKTRGELHIQDGEVINLDEHLADGFEKLCQLPLNPPPPTLSVSEPAQPPAMVTPALRKLSPGERAAECSTLAEVRERFNTEHTLESLLHEYGAIETSDGYSCPCGIPHTHETTLSISRQGKLFSYSPRCKWYTTNGWDAFGLYVLVEYHNDITAALKALNPSRPKSPRDLPPPGTPPARYQTKAQAQDAARKREMRRQEAVETLAEVLSRASQDEALSDRAQLVLLALVDVAERGIDGKQDHPRDWCRPSVARLAEMCSYERRTVFYALAELEEHGYISSTPARGGTTLRTFLRVQRVTVEQVYKAPELGGTTLRTLLPVQRVQTEQECNAPQLDTASDREILPGACERAPQLPGEPAPIPEPVAWEGGASYNPAHDFTVGGVLDLSGWRDPRQMQVRETLHDDQSEAEARMLDLIEPEPEVRCPPSEEPARTRYYKLRGAAKKARSPAQRRKLDRDADALMVWLPFSEASEVHPRSPAPRLVGLGRPRSGRPSQAPTCTSTPLAVDMFPQPPPSDGGIVAGLMALKAQQDEELGANRGS